MEVERSDEWESDLSVTAEDAALPTRYALVLLHWQGQWGRRFYLNQRSRGASSLPGRIGLFGGHVDPIPGGGHERFDQAVLRETEEELGYTIDGDLEVLGKFYGTSAKGVPSVGVFFAHELQEDMAVRFRKHMHQTRIVHGIDEGKLMVLDERQVFDRAVTLQMAPTTLMAVITLLDRLVARRGS
ncbi:MAG: NUDIX domain-containing protein [Pseudomonadota bacterium]